ncbi:MAG: T9SS type A sorting domain-containing protein [Bacteroidales bacterium]|nr:T9SS type A sorting domain-containing protein [Bacteroidales bacterium]
MRKLQLILISFLLVILSQAKAQHLNILIAEGNGLSEPSIFVNPNNTDEIVAGAIINKYYYSQDGGFSWNSGSLTSPYGVWGDPCLIVDSNSDYYYFHLSNPTNGSWIDRIVCQKSVDGGSSWNTGTYMGLNGTKAQDKQWAIVDYTNNNIYVSWTQFDQYGSSSPSHFSNIHFSKTLDGGETWSEAIQINEISGDCVDEGNTVEGAVPAVGLNGEIFVSWAGPEGLVFDKSLDQGESWLDEDIFVSDIPGPGWAYEIPGISRCNGLPITCCNLAEGPYQGEIYINWSDQRNGSDDTDIWFIKSSDGGETWDERKRVNDDAPGKQQFFTWMTVDQITGYIWFVFYDRRNYEDNNTDVYMAVSTDGGESFYNFQVSETPFLPYSSTFFGDYTNISAHDNVVRPIWTRLEGSSPKIMTALVNESIIGEEELEALPFSLQQNSPNPFDETTFISFKLQKKQKVSLIVYDIFSRPVAVMIQNKELNMGKHTYHLSSSDYHLSNGVYYFSLIAGDYQIQKKMLLVK